MTWIPDQASQQLEELMESLDLPEEDRDELRRFAEVLRRKKDVREGKKLEPLPPGMFEWLTGRK